MVGNLLLPEIQGMIQERNFTALRELFCEMPPADVAEIILDLPEDERVIIFRILPNALAADRASEQTFKLPDPRLGRPANFPQIEPGVLLTSAALDAQPRIAAVDRGADRWRRPEWAAKLLQALVPGLAAKLVGDLLRFLRLFVLPAPSSMTPSPVWSTAHGSERCRRVALPASR